MMALKSVSSLVRFITDYYDLEYWNTGMMEKWVYLNLSNCKLR
jgi:hypothetical protein